MAAAGLHCCEPAISGGHTINVATERLRKNWPTFGHPKKEKREEEKEVVERGGGSRERRRRRRRRKVGSNACL